MAHLISYAIEFLREEIDQELDDDDASCSQNGVIAPLVGIIGSMQAMEVLKIICKVGNSLVGRLLLLDASTAQWREMRLLKNPNCEACGNL